MQQEINQPTYVNYHGLKSVACDYAKSRVAIGWLTLGLAKSFSFMGFPQQLQPALHGELDAVKRSSCFCLTRLIPLRESCPAKRFVPRSPSYSGFARVPYLRLNWRRGTSLRHHAKGQLDIGFREYIDDCGHSRGTIHPHPEGLRSSLPLDPKKLK